jgi:hypothetical protein
VSEESLDDKALRLLGLDPETHVVVGTPRFKTWQLHHGEWRESCQATVAERDMDVDYDALVRQLRRRTLAAPPTETGDAFVFVMADWQLGKSDGDGVTGTVARVTAAIHEAERRVKALRKSGRVLDCLVLAGLGDIIEGCSGHYPSQPFTVALDRRQQCALARELITQAVVRLAPLFDSVVLAAVPGNHGENRQGTKAITGVSDNDDLAVFEQVWEAIQMSERFPTLTFLEPEPGEVHVTLAGDEWGAGLCLFHGHTSGSKDMNKWWAGQTQGRQAPGNASVLVTGHYHHFKVSEESGRTWLQAPSPESCSQWWVNRSGQSSLPGTLSFVLTDDGVDEIKVLGRTAGQEAA